MELPDPLGPRAGVAGGEGRWVVSSVTQARSVLLPVSLCRVIPCLPLRALTGTTAAPR